MCVDTEATRERFTAAALRLADEIHAAIPAYDPKRFRNMVVNEGGVVTARKLLRPNADNTAGYERLLQAGLVRTLSLEALVLHPDWSCLFTDAELLVARRRVA